MKKQEYDIRLREGAQGILGVIHTTQGVVSKSCPQHNILCKACVNCCGKMKYFVESCPQIYFLIKTFFSGGTQRKEILKGYLTLTSDSHIIYRTVNLIVCGTISDAEDDDMLIIIN
ncbi:hypothetical protein [Salipaludibacillus neizhouensis]|uniref:hypothetical protein n=1 Tax=Salipaludibacillus neizhouensis TaxID=885475 RepID=UPI0011C3A36D|nr:hypothetical protein [Salipaludibacillus neizhouensis]